MKERILFIIFFIVNNLVISIISINKGYIFLKANNSFITLKIKGPGIQSIYYYDSEICHEEWKVKSFEFIPNEIYINSNKQNNISFQYYFNNSINNVVLLWYNNLNSLNCLFRECKNIIDIDLSNFNSSNVNSMDSMFLDCQSLLSINFTNFKTSSVTNMATMFSGCISLVSLDLSYFDTSQVVQIQYMFKNSISLKYLNLSNFNLEKVNRMENMFENCKNIEYINFGNTNINNNLENRDNIFLGTSKNFIICTQSSLLISQLSDCVKINCSYYSKEFRKKIYFNNETICADDCIDTDYKYEYNYKCYENCPNGTYNNNFICEDCHPNCKTCDKGYTLNNTNCKSCLSENKFLQYGNCVDECLTGYYEDETDSSIKICECELKQCKICSTESLENGLCLSCNEGYYPIYNESSDNNSFKNCSTYLEGYYLDNDILKTCYFTCKKCNVSGNNYFHNCIECKSKFIFEMNINNYKNCYDNCTYYYYFDSNLNKYFCTENKKCPYNFSILIPESGECVKNNSIYIQYPNKLINESYITYQKETTTHHDDYIYNEIICDNENPFLIIEKQECVKNCSINDIISKLCIIKNINSIDIILKNIDNQIISEDYNTSKIENGEDEIIEFGKITITLTSSQNQKNNSNYNKTKIDLRECETLLRKTYNISDDEILYMKKIDIAQENMKIPKIEYNIYSKLFKTNLTKLNLSICQSTTIDLYIPIIIKENIDFLNSSSAYFNDICYIATSNGGTDIILKDRKEDFIENNKTVCQEDCLFSEYEKQTVKCSCKVKEASSSSSDMNINITKLNELFKGSESQQLLSNLGITKCNILSSKDNIVSNTGFYLLTFIIIVFIIVFIIFSCKGYDSLENKIDDIIYKKFDKYKNEANIENNNIIKKSKNTKKNKKPKNKKKNKNKSLSAKSSSSNFKFPKKETKIKIDKNNNSIIKSKSKKSKKKNQSNINDMTNYELNWLIYEEAIKCDKRTYCEYYLSLIQSKQLFIFTFCDFDDYNSGIIKKFIFFLSFAFHYTVNALFFNDSIMHKIYKDDGKFNFEYQFSNIIFSSIISIFILRLILQFLVLTDKDLLEVKQQGNKKQSIFVKDKKLKCMKIKFTIFFILNFIMLILFWYYLTCFNAIYRNTQVYLIENTCISFGISFFYPFIINILPMIIRISSINSLKKNKRYKYKISQFLQLI